MSNMYLQSFATTLYDPNSIHQLERWVRQFAYTKNCVAIHEMVEQQERRKRGLNRIYFIMFLFMAIGLLVAFVIGVMM